MSEYFTECNYQG